MAPRRCLSPSTSEYWFPWCRCPHLSSLANLTTASPMTGSFGWSTWGHSLADLYLWPTTSVRRGQLRRSHTGLDQSRGGTIAAFRIDGTVTPGVNNPLLLESGVADNLFRRRDMGFLRGEFYGRSTQLWQRRVVRFWIATQSIFHGEYLGQPGARACGILSTIGAMLLCLVSGIRRK